MVYEWTVSTWAIGQLGQVEEAERLHRESMAKRTETLGLAATETWFSVESVIHICKQRGDVQEAERLAHDVYEARRAEFGDDHPWTLKSCHYFALFLVEQGRHAEALPLARDLVQLTSEEDTRPMRLRTALLAKIGAVLAAEQD